MASVNVVNQKGACNLTAFGVLALTANNFGFPEVISAAVLRVRQAFIFAPASNAGAAITLGPRISGTDYLIIQMAPGTTFVIPEISGDTFDISVWHFQATLNGDVLYILYR